MPSRLAAWPIALLVAALATLMPSIARADNLGALGVAVALLAIGLLSTIGLMVTFIVLAVKLGGAARAADGRGAGLVLTTRVLAGLVVAGIGAIFAYYLVFGPGRDFGWVALFVLAMGLPTFIPAAIALFRAGRVAKTLR